MFTVDVLHISHDVLFWTSLLISFSDQEPAVVETDVVEPNHSSQLPKETYGSVPGPCRANDCEDGMLITNDPEG